MSFTCLEKNNDFSPTLSLTGTTNAYPMILVVLGHSNGGTGVIPIGSEITIRITGVNNNAGAAQIIARFTRSGIVETGTKNVNQVTMGSVTVNIPAGSFTITETIASTSVVSTLSTTYFSLSASSIYENIEIQSAEIITSNVNLFSPCFKEPLQCTSCVEIQNFGLWPIWDSNDTGFRVHISKVTIPKCLADNGEGNPQGNFDLRIYDGIQTYVVLQLQLSNAVDDGDNYVFDNIENIIMLPNWRLYINSFNLGSCMGDEKVCVYGEIIEDINDEHQITLTGISNDIACTEAAIQNAALGYKKCATLDFQWNGPEFVDSVFVHFSSLTSYIQGDYYGTSHGDEFGAYDIAYKAYYIDSEGGEIQSLLNEGVIHVPAHPQASYGQSKNFLDISLPVIRDIGVSEPEQDQWIRLEFCMPDCLISPDPSARIYLYGVIDGVTLNYHDYTFPERPTQTQSWLPLIAVTGLIAAFAALIFFVAKDDKNKKHKLKEKKK